MKVVDLGQIHGGHCFGFYKDGTYSFVFVFDSKFKKDLWVKLFSKNDNVNDSDLIQICMMSCKKVLYDVTYL